MNSAVLSVCGKYRYRLDRSIGTSELKIAWFGVNPSTADHWTDDQTIKKMIGFSRILGAGHMIVGNLFPVRATDVRELGEVNEEAWRIAYQTNIQIASEADIIVACWGSRTKLPDHLRPQIAVMKSLLTISCKTPSKLLCLGLTVTGDPKHPLMLPYSTPFQRYYPYA